MIDKLYGNVFREPPKYGNYFEQLPINRWPEQSKPCRHLNHQPPTMLYIAAGEIYLHICPGCGQQTQMAGSSLTM